MLRETDTWMGAIPESWATPPLYATYDVQLGKMLNPDAVQGDHLAPYLRNVDVQWDRINTDGLPEMNFPPEFVARYRLRKGDLLVCEGGEVGRTAIWNDELPECYYQKALHRLRPRTGGQNRRFMYYALFAAAQNGAFEEGGSKSTILHLPAEKLRRHRFPLPSTDEQRAIADFLDRKTAAIDALIAKKERLIELLEEKRQALITQAVTKGLDPSVPMKDSGIEWLGPIPAHWSVKRLKQLSEKVSVGIVVTPAKYYDDAGTVPALRSLNLRPRRIVSEDLVYISEQSNALLEKSKLRAGDIVAVRTGQPGTTAVVPAHLDGVNCIDLIIIRQSPRMSSGFVCEFMNSGLAKRQYVEGSEGAIQQHFNIETAKNLLLPAPPVEEQEGILAHLVKTHDRFDRLTQLNQAHVAALREYRQALITAAVTGKIDLTAEPK